MADRVVGSKIAEGKTKEIFELCGDDSLNILIKSKDRITAGDGAKSHVIEGKAAIATTTTVKIFEFLSAAGLETHFVKQVNDVSFIARHCEMIPIEWVVRRIATGSFLKRNPGVKEGHRFAPLKLETFYKDDANNDPQWSREQILSAEFSRFGKVIGTYELDHMERLTIGIFEVLERAWAHFDCTLVDMKVEFGVDKSGKILLADVIDNDSWRLWPAGKRVLMKDKQVYRDLTSVDQQALATVKTNYEWVAEKVKCFSPVSLGRIVVFMGSSTDNEFCMKIKKIASDLSIGCYIRTSSAHKATADTLNIVSQYESDGVPTVIIAVAGRSNGLGPVLSGNTCLPVINCPPISADWGSEDIWSSLRLPSGLGCATVTSPEAAVLHAASILGLHDYFTWSRLRFVQFNNWVSIKKADQACVNIIN